METLYGYSATHGAKKYVRAPGNELYFPVDELVDFNHLLAEPEPPIPLDVTFSVHWLAIEGVQPAIPLNPSLRKKEKAAQLRKKKLQNPAVKPVVAHVLSVELQRYYEEVTKAVLGNDAQKCKAALASVAADPGLNDLCPYFSQFLADKVTDHVQDLPVLTHLMLFLQALLRSEHFHVEPYLHQLMPPLLTCLVGKQLCADPATQDHWALRDLAASLVRYVCETYGTTHRNLQPRITKTLLDAFLKPDRPLTTHYGAFRGLTQLGMAVMQTLVLPNLPQYVAALKPALTEGTQLKRAEAQKVYRAILQDCAEYVKSASSLPAQMAQNTKPNAAPGVPVPELSYEAIHAALLPDVPAWTKMLRELLGPDFEKLLSAK